MSEENTPAISIRIAGNDKAHVQPPASVANASGIMSTATGYGGHTLSRAPSDTDIVTVDGISMQIGMAVQQGYLHRTADGGYADGPQAGAAEDGPDDPEADDEEDEDLSEALAFDDETAEALTDAAAALSAAGANPAGAIGSLLVNPDRLPDQFKVLAEEAGIDEGRALQHVRNMAASVEEAIGEYVVANGISPEQLEAFWTYAQRHVPPPKFSGMVSQAVFMGDASPFKSVVRNFISEHGSGRGRATKTSRARGGLRSEMQETVTVDGVRMSLETARRIGAV